MPLPRRLLLCCCMAAGATCARPRPPLPARLRGGCGDGPAPLRGAASTIAAELDRELETTYARVAALGELDEDESGDGKAEAGAEANSSVATKGMSTMERIGALEARKAELELAIDQQTKDLEEMGAPAAEVGNFWETHVPLVDAEGFPRSDIPIEEVLKGRARLAGLRIRYKDTMDRLQAAIGDYFADAS